jgi:hypothetical protein
MRSGSTTTSSGVSASPADGLRPEDSVSQAGRDDSAIGTEYTNEFEQGSANGSGANAYDPAADPMAQ